MNIVILIKQVPDSEARIKVAPEGNGIVSEGIKYVISPYDEYALEEGIRIKEKLGGSVTALTMGPERAVEVLRTALAVGADQAIHLHDAAFAGTDSLGTARILAAALGKLPFDLVLAGKQGIDYDMAQVGPRVAALLGIPCVTMVDHLELDPAGGSATVKREAEGRIETIRVTLPALLTAQKGLNEPRYASLMGIMKAKKQPITQWGATDLGLSGQTGESLSAVKLLSLATPPQRPPGRILEGEPAQAVKELVRLLKTEAKVL